MENKITENTENINKNKNILTKAGYQLVYQIFFEFILLGGLYELNKSPKLNANLIPIFKYTAIGIGVLLCLTLVHYIYLKFFSKN